MGSNNADAPIDEVSCSRSCVRLAKASTLVRRLTVSWTIHTLFVDALMFFVFIRVVAHLLACFFYLWPVLTECETRQSHRDIRTRPHARKLEQMVNQGYIAACCTYW